MSNLTQKQDKFVKAYLLNGGNAMQAAISAGYSEKTAGEMGYENLKKPQIKKAIESHQKKAESDFIWSKQKKLELLQRIASVASSEDGEKGMINMQSAIAAIKEHNLMQGDNAPIKTESDIRMAKSFSDVYGGKSGES
ncbi:MAG TPA: terminase small subunit [Psychromonas sp.]